MRGSTAGLTDPLKGSSPMYYMLLVVLDNVFSALVVAPAVVGYWRSTWRLTIMYLYPDSPLTSSVLSLGIGMAGHLVFGLFQGRLSQLFHPDKHRIMFYVMSRLYTACYAFTCVNSWKGAWELLDVYTEGEIATVLATTVVSVVSLCAMRALRNVAASPCVIVTDSAEGFFDIPTMFKTVNSEKPCMFVLDSLFSVFIIGSLVVFVWRGGWVLLDKLIYPDNLIWSCWTSLVVGYLLVTMAFSMQPVLRRICDKLTGFWRLLVADLFLLFSIIGTVNVWRGVWMLLDIYFLPDHPEMSCWITHIFSLILLILLNCGNTLLVRGVYVDGEESDGKCVLFPCYYLRLIFKNERVKRMNRRLRQNALDVKKDELECCTCFVEQNHVILLPQTKTNYVEA